VKVVTLGNLELTKLFHKQDELLAALRSTIVADVVDQLAHLELTPHVLAGSEAGAAEDVETDGGRLMHGMMDMWV
jgi:hypothetical protein